MHHGLRVLALALSASAGVGLAQAGQGAFKDWIVGCDNLRSCTALGLTKEDDGNTAFIKVTRDGAADAEAVAEVVVGSDEATTTLFFTIDGERTKLSASHDEYYARAKLTAEMLAKIANAKELRVATMVGGGNRVNDPIDISPDGAAAALRFMDAEQKRDGGVTALVAKGDKPASAVPAVPPAPEVAVQAITQLDPLPAMPKGLEPADEFCAEGEMGYIAYKLSATQLLWGSCVSAGAYNFTYVFAIVEGAKVTPFSFAIPGATPEEMDGSLTNPWLGDGGTLSAFGKGRGIGDCGDSSEWGWDGATFQPLSYSALYECRGISSFDWPILYTAKKKS